MRRADLAVLRRREVRGERGLEFGGGWLGMVRGVGICVEAVEWIEEAEVEWECRARPLGGILRFETELDAEACWVRIGGDGFVSSCPTHQSHNPHPTNVPTEPHPTTAPGDIRSW